MSLLDPAQRAATGVTTRTAVTGAPAAEPDTLLAEATRDFVFAEVWSRPGLDRRARYLVALAAVAIADGASPRLDDYVRGALIGEFLTLGELREAALHLAAYGGWPKGEALDAAITRVAGALGLAPAPYAPFCGNSRSSEERLAKGARGFEDAMKFAAPPPMGPFLEAGILNFIFAEMWMRPGLDQRARRWITLVGVCNSGADTPIRTHIHAAMASGDCTADELQEFILHYAAHAGWPKAAMLQTAVAAMAKKVEAGLPYSG